MWLDSAWKDPRHAPAFLTVRECTGTPMLSHNPTSMFSHPPHGEVRGRSPAPRTTGRVRRRRCSADQTSLPHVDGTRGAWFEARRFAPSASP